MNYAAAITLYNPQKDFIDNLLGYTKSFPLVIVNDNSRDNHDYRVELENNRNILYIWDGNNYGLPISFNRSLKICEERGIDFLCTLDQDSKLSYSSINDIKQYIETHEMSNVGIVAPKPVDINCETSPNDTTDVVDVPWVICSGAFVNIKTLRVNNITYDDAYFVDRFDADLCKQVYDSGLKQILLNGVKMPHACGDENGHSILRNYYIFRNRFYFNDKYYPFFQSKIRSIVQTVRHCYYLCTSQKDSIKKIKTLSVAYNDYINGRLGKICDKSLDMINKISK